MQAIYFTTKVATDNSFCNRIDERDMLFTNIQKNQHTVVVAPRRYGKTSLVMHTLIKTDQIFARVDLFCVIYEEDICRKVATGISNLIKQNVLKADESNKIQAAIMLCHKILLDRISRDDFNQHIQIASERRWKSKLPDDEVVSTILSLTELHPYYVNLLCDLLWGLKKKPHLQDVYICWNKALFDNKNIIYDTAKIQRSSTYLR